MTDTLCGGNYVDWGDDGSCQFWQERRVVARKIHSCCECGGEIRPGDEYGRASGKYDRDFYVWKRCPSCLVLAELVSTLTGGECALWSELTLYIEEVVHDDHPEVPTAREHRQRWDAA